MGKCKECKIVIISLIKNEDLNIQKVLENVIDFADEMIVLDNMSDDNTYSIVKEMAVKNPKIELHKVKSFKSSGAYLTKYMNTPTWVLSVDGDEVYDKEGLIKLRKELIKGTYSDKWAVCGRFINCFKKEDEFVEGYMSPPSKLSTRLYNFNAIKRWRQSTERLHGGKPRFNKGYKLNDRHMLHEEFNWDDINLRFIHLCFLPRSSNDNGCKRLNPAEKNSARYKNYKDRLYKYGEINKISTKGFFDE